MSETKWTPAQQAAINDRGGALLVSAAAGSGKTAVLTERAVRLITDPERPVDADRLLIVTFTNAAAAELRARIGQALLRRSQAEPGSAFLRRQRMLLQRAPICTIDAFCLELLHRHFQALDIPPDFSTADAGSVETLRAEALSETLEETYRDPDFCAFADLYGKGRSDRAAGEMVLRVYDFLRALPNYHRELDAMLEPWQQENGFGQSVWKTLLLEQAGQYAEAAGQLLAVAAERCSEDRLTARLDAEESKKTPAAKEKAGAAAEAKFSEPLDRLTRAQELMQQVIGLCRAGQWDALYDLLTPYVLGMEEQPGLKGMKTRLSGDHKQTVRTCADEAAALFGRITELVGCSEAEAEEDRRRALPRLRALFDAVRQFDRRFSAKKLERRMLEFSDFEHYALQLLCTPEGEPTALCESIRQEYAAVMVDEYQDTNALQEQLYRCLASPAGDDLFLVGDLKQSIYRFRQAAPEIFREKLERWPLLPDGMARPRPAEGEPGTDALIALDANFRSAPQVVDGINFIFEQLMTRGLGDTDYGEGQRLVCGAPGEYQGSVEVEFYPDDSAETDAAWIAGRIRALVDSGEPVRDGSGTRPVRFEDCCILLSARADFPIYAQQLEAHGIPAYADARENLLDAPHIRPLIALLRVIDNPAQDIYLAAAMLGPVFGFTDDDLVRLRAQRRRTSLYGAVLAVVNGEEQSPFADKLRAFYARLTELRRMARSAPVEQLMEEIFASTGYLAALGAMENGTRRREDARRFAAFCAAMGGGGISALVRAIDAAERVGTTGQETAPGGARPGCVSIMTIHRSKGLQFPVVFVAGTGRRFNAVDVRQPVLLHRSGGVGLRLCPEQGDGSYKTPAYAAIAGLHEQEMRSEQMRLMYVALTRAQDKLILTVPLGVSRTTNACEKAAAFIRAGEERTLHRQANCFADWLRAALLVHPDGRLLRQEAGDLDFTARDAKGRICIGLLEPDAAATQPDAQPEEQTPADPALVEQLRAGFAWHYPAAALSALPAKVSVTSLVHKSEQTTLERPAFLSKDGLTAAEMGTAVHAFLEHAEFAPLEQALRQGGEALEQAICAERDRQVSARLTSPEIAEKLNVQQITDFVKSEAFERICKAQQVLRELDFITALPASRVLEAGDAALAGQPVQQAHVLVQGIADLLLVYPDHLELLDYKTDRRKSAQELLAAYRPQLELYAAALDKRFAPLRVTYRGIYSFALGRLIEA